MVLPCRYSSDKAGQYELAVKSPLDGEPLAGSPFSLTVTPGKLSPAHCTAQLAHSGDCLTAGSQALICIQAKDRFGNNVKPLPNASPASPFSCARHASSFCPSHTLDLWQPDLQTFVGSS